MKQLKTIKFPGLDDTYFVPEYDLTNYATKEYVLENVPDLAGVATEEYVQEQIGAIEHPTVDLTGYATEEYVDNAIAGGSANVDGQTIIEENGVIRTAIDIVAEPDIARQNYYECVSEAGITANSNGTVTVNPRFSGSTTETLVTVENLHYEVIYERNGEMVYITEEAGCDWATCQKAPNGSLQFNNWKQVIPEATYEYCQVYDGADVPFCGGTSSQTNYSVGSTLRNSGFKLYALRLYVPGVRGARYVSNDCIDTNYIATREYVAELIGGIENGSY